MNRKKIGVVIMSLVVISAFVGIELINAASATSGNALDPAAETMTKSKDATIQPGNQIELFVPCAAASCAPSKYHSAKVIITIVVTSFSSSQSDVQMSFFFGNTTSPPKGFTQGSCPSFVLTCPRKDFGFLPTFQGGALTVEYDGYDTIIRNTGSSAETVAYSWTALFEGGST